MFVHMSSNWVQMIQNFTRNDLGTKKIRFGHFEKKIFFWGGFSREKPKLSLGWDLSIYLSIYKTECLSVCYHLEPTVFVHMSSNWVQMIQNFTRNDLGTKNSASDTLVVLLLCTRAKPGIPASEK